MWQMNECKKIKILRTKNDRPNKPYQGSKSPVGEPLTIDAPLCAYAPPYDGIDMADDDDDDDDVGVPTPPMVGKKRR